MDYTIRSANPTDVHGIATVARTTWAMTYAQSITARNQRQFLDRAYAPQALDQAIAREQNWLFVATARDDSVVGFAHYLRRFDAQGELVRLYVHPDHQRRRIGRALLEAGLDSMAAAGISHCYVSVQMQNTHARAFYEKFGFRHHREHVRFLENQLLQLVEYTAPIAALRDSIITAGKPD